MNHRTRKLISLFIGIPALLWLLLFIFSPPMPSTPRARGLFRTLDGQAQDLKGRSFSRDELDLEISRLDLNLQMNRYATHVKHHSSTNWSIELTPEKKKTYANPATTFQRYSTLEFERFEWPDILIRSKE